MYCNRILSYTHKVYNFNHILNTSFRNTGVRFLGSQTVGKKTLDKKYDVVVHGASGFTGQYVVEELARVAELEKANIPLKWAISGRNKEKLVSVLDAIKSNTGYSLKDVGLIIADNAEESTLNSMASQAKCVINCVGPYVTYGEPVVKACVNNETNHVDISGEPQYLEKMQLKYDSTAEKAGVHIVGACGYDSVPADVGVMELSKHFKGRLNSVDCFYKVKGAPGGSIHTGTLESIALFVRDKNKIGKIRRELYSHKLSKPKYFVMKKQVHFNEDLKCFGLQFPSDESQVYRSQRSLFELKGVPPVQFHGYLSVRSQSRTFVMMLGLIYFFTLCSFNWTRVLLLKYPEFFTAGMFSSEGPKIEALKKMAFTINLIGSGWSEKLEKDSENYSTPPDTKKILTIKGPDPGYQGTALMLVASAMTIIREKELCTRRGGVMPPGIAFMNTKIVDRMTARGMKFSIK